MPQKIVLSMLKKDCLRHKTKECRTDFCYSCHHESRHKTCFHARSSRNGKDPSGSCSHIGTKENFKQIYLARPIVPLSNKDIGYLPGDIKSKLNPYMEPLFDNLKFIQNQFNETDSDYQRITEMVNKEKLVITPLAYIRGRSLSNICFIVDEAQNLTPHEVKTIISRAGENTKIIFTGDIYQIDTPYLDSQSNGLSFLIDRLRNHKLYAHVTLEKESVRSWPILQMRCFKLY